MMTWQTKDIISAGTAAMLAVTLVATGVSTAASPLADPRTRRQPVDHRLYHATLASRELAHNRSSKPASHRFDLFEPEWACPSFMLSGCIESAASQLLGAL